MARLTAPFFSTGFGLGCFDLGTTALVDSASAVRSCGRTLV
ncbi:hypothetical protein AB0F08_16860 [Streptomyces gardneri]